MVYKTPGVYVQEVALFPPSVAPVATAIPAFIGYTARAETPDGAPLADIPTRITSLLDFETYFGTEYPVVNYTVNIDPALNQIKAVIPDRRFHLYPCLRQFYDNGGGPCYIMSVGLYDDGLDTADFTRGIAALKAFDEPTLLAFPDAVELVDAGKPDITNFSELQKQALALCAALQDRFCLLDVLEGNRRQDATFKPFDNFRDTIGVNNLHYGAAYYPFIITSYPVSVSFRQLVLKNNADPPVALTATELDSLSKNDQERALLTALQTRITQSDEVFKNITSLTAVQLQQKGVDAVREKLQELENTIARNENATTVETAFTAWLDVHAGVANRFKVVETALPADAALLKEVQKLKTDQKLKDALVSLVSVEKNAKVRANTSRSAADTEALYTPLNGDWLNGQAYNDIAAATEPEPTPDKFTKNSAGARAIIRFLNTATSNLLNGYGSLITAARFFENLEAQRLFTQHTFYKGLQEEVTRQMQTIPPSGSLAGVCAYVDRTRGVWKAPANLSLHNVIGPAVKIDNTEQDDLNVHSTGKSINAIRAFTGKGTLVWGARTLAGNDNEWRYVPVRRFFIFVEESVKKATEPFVFDNNDANTWVKVRSMIQNFLTLQWRSGALQGAKPEDAFYVSVGLGETMTALDILEGRMIVEIGLAVVRPAEFIILRFSHKMQES